MRLAERTTHWQTRADQIRETVLREAWNDRLGSFTASFGGDDIDASLLLTHEVGFISPKDPALCRHDRRRRARVEARPAPVPLRQGRRLRPAGECVHRLYFLVHRCAERPGPIGAARALFENMLDCRDHLGLLSEDINPESNELWGNFPQTYSLIGLITAR